MKLFYREYGSYSEERPTLLFLHGLLGSSSNWHSIARSLENDYHILVPDLRNHGRSPHAPAVGYPELVGDLEALVDDQGLEDVVLIGHSMGGKAAMLYALGHPAAVSALVVVDIAPVAYPSRFDAVFEALNGLDLPAISGREAADRALAGAIADTRLRHYLLQNLQLKDGRWEWRINVKALAERLGDILSFPDVPGTVQYAGPVLFLYGTESDYLQPGFEAAIRAHFPLARLRPVTGAGHWVYAEQPRRFVDALRRFLSKEVR